MSQLSIIINEITQYIDELNQVYKAGNATEHTYRPALKSLLENIVRAKNFSPVQVTNEPKRIACGAPDYIVTRNEIPVGYLEAKDIDTDLNHKIHTLQFDRYKQSLNNLIITNYLTFQLFENGTPVTSVTIAKTKKNGIETDKTQFELFIELVNRFTGYEGETILTSTHLSKVMAAKAKLLANTIEKALDEDETPDGNIVNHASTLLGQLNGFREVLIHDMEHKEFADIYAQTIAYGMFAARLHDETKERFTRFKAAQFIPHSNPFLRKLFQYIAGYDLDERIRWIVNDLADMFNYVDIYAIINEFDKTDHDPIVHFYETFLAEYDPSLRKSRGVWYTPQPVVKFMVQAVDDILKEDFELLQGLSDTSKVKLKQRFEQKNGKFVEEEKEYHKVQILDPATGTGTFLAEVIQNIYKSFKKQKGMWQSYVNEHLIPRINGFEILMASYAMAHLKLDMVLQKTGYTSPNPSKGVESIERLRIYLTNSLDEARADVKAHFAQWLSNEANEANHIKHNAPVMVVLGNPPYSGESQNSGEWMNKLMNDYKKEPSGGKLMEKNAKWINDDYVKFIRFGQYFIEKNGEGILAFINNHSFLDNPTFRGMRWSLLQTFDKIYILNLHGNARKKETTPDGSKDENIFDIQQGVSINIFVKKSNRHCEPDTQSPQNKQLAAVYYADLYGKRTDKYNFLLNNNLQTTPWQQINFFNGNCFFVPKDYELKAEYEEGFSVKELFPVNSVGVTTARDNFTIHNTVQAVKNTINEFIKLDIETARNRFDLGKDARDWSVSRAQKDLTANPDFSRIIEINYHPFDKRFTYYTGHSKGFHCMPRENVMQHFLITIDDNGIQNIGLIINRPAQGGADIFTDVFITKTITDQSIFSAIKRSPFICPLYIYIKNGITDNDKRPYHKQPNLNVAIIKEIAQRLGLQFNEEVRADLCGYSDLQDVADKTCHDGVDNTFAPIDILDYIYAVLHSPTYRERYKDFLKTDFPRVPYPVDAEQFWKLVKLGGKLRRMHLMEKVELHEGIADFPISGNDVVEKIEYHPLSPPAEERGRVYINDTQYFDNVPLVAWNFYIGGYQPAQKWLKDRKDQILSFEDIRHYQKIIWVLWETDKVMKKLYEVMKK